MGPLAGIKVVEFAGIGPAPMCAMLLADLGATVIRIDRPNPTDLGIEKPLKYNLLLRGRPSISLDLKDEAAVEVALRIVKNSDVLIEGFRPGAMERNGLGPDECLKVNPKLVYGRMTGWGQTGPLAQTAGHDLNYISLSGALHAIGRRGGPPTPPLNLIGDFGGGAMLLAFGILAAVHAARDAGSGQVVDAAMLEGSALLMTSFYGLQAAGLYRSERGTNVLDSGAPYYDVYECADGNYLGVAPIELKFRKKFFELLGLDTALEGEALRAEISARLIKKTRGAWQAIFEGTDACVTPVLSMAEAPDHPHNKARNSFVDVDGVLQPAPAPRFSATPTQLPRPPAVCDANPHASVAPWSFTTADVDALILRGVMRKAAPPTGEHN